MRSVTIDPGVLAVPLGDCGVDDVYKYIDTILDWKKLLNEPWVAIYMSERASECLLEDGLYPLRDQLRSLFSDHGVVEYDVNTVAKVVDRLLQLTPSFETYFGLKDVLSEQFETDPDIIQLSMHEGLQSDLARCVTLISVLRKHCKQTPSNHSLILRDAPKQVIKVRAQIHELEHERDDITGLPIHPDFFEGDILVCDDFRGLIDCLDESAILTGATDNHGIELAIRISIYKKQIRANLDPDWNNLCAPIIGEGFRAKAQRCCADQPDSLPHKILRAINEVIDHENMTAVHALRTSSGGNSSQRMRGSDKAQRRDIDREFHLHYWECDDGTIELASVVYHNDFTIPE